MSTLKIMWATFWMHEPLTKGLEVVVRVAMTGCVATQMDLHLSRSHDGNPNKCTTLPADEVMGDSPYLSLTKDCEGRLSCDPKG